MSTSGVKLENRAHDVRDISESHRGHPQWWTESRQMQGRIENNERSVSEQVEILHQRILKGC
jgi:hypothetical protein